MPDFVDDDVELATKSGTGVPSIGNTDAVSATDYNNLREASYSLRAAVQALQGAIVGSSAWVSAGSGIKYTDGNVGIGTGGDPGQLLHLSGGNLLIDGAGESAGILMKRNGDVGTAEDPIFQWGRIYEAGIGEPAFSIFFWDAVTAEKRIWSQEATGTVAVIQGGTRRSAYECFITDGDVHPAMRINTWPSTRLELGTGSAATQVHLALDESSNTTFGVEIGGNRNFQVNGDTVKVSQGVTLHARGSYAGEIWVFGGSQTIGAQQYLACDASAGNATVTLPAASSLTGRVFNIKKIDSSVNTVTVDPAGSETIDGASTKVLSTQWEKVTIVSDGSNWLIF